MYHTVLSFSALLPSFFFLRVSSERQLCWTSSTFSRTRNTGTRKELSDKRHGDPWVKILQLSHLLIWLWKPYATWGDILQVDICMPRDGDGNRHCQLKINILTFKKAKNNLILSAIIWNTYQATIPPPDGHIIAQSLVEDPLWAKALRTLLPAIFSVSVLWQDSVYQVVLLSKWTLAISLCLGKTNLQNITDQSFTATYKVYYHRHSIGPISVIYPALFFLLSSFSVHLLLSCQTDLETWRPKTSPWGPHEQLGHLERQCSPHSYALTHPSLCSHFTPSRLCWRPETILARSHCLVLLSV